MDFKSANGVKVPGDEIFDEEVRVSGVNEKVSDDGVRVSGDKYKVFDTEVKVCLGCCVDFWCVVGYDGVCSDCEDSVKTDPNWGKVSDDKSDGWSSSSSQTNMSPPKKVLKVDHDKEESTKLT